MWSVDTCVLGVEVCSLIKAAYPDQSLSETSQIEEIMKTFWMDIEYGAEVMQANSDAFEEEEENDDDSDEWSREITVQCGSERKVVC